MGRNPNYSNLDVQQMQAYAFDEANDAQRVVLVGGEGMTFNFDKIDMKMPEILKETCIVKELEIKEIEKPIIIIQEKIEKIEVPVIVKEVQVVEIEKVIEKIVYKEINIPVVTKEIEIVRVPEYLEKVVEKEVEVLPLYYKILMIAMGIVTLGSILIHVK